MTKPRKNNTGNLQAIKYKEVGENCEYTALQKPYKNYTREQTKLQITEKLLKTKFQEIQQCCG